MHHFFCYHDQCRLIQNSESGSCFISCLYAEIINISCIFEWTSILRLSCILQILLQELFYDWLINVNYVPLWLQHTCILKDSLFSDEVVTIKLFVSPEKRMGKVTPLAAFILLCVILLCVVHHVFFYHDPCRPIQNSESGLCLISCWYAEIINISCKFEWTSIRLPLLLYYGMYYDILIVEYHSYCFAWLITVVVFLHNAIWK